MRWLSLATVEGVVRGRLQRAKRVPARAPQVLVVEDSAIVRDMVRELIEQEGIEVLTAVSGEEALEVLSVHPDIALTVTDLQMPGLDALLLVRSISKRMPVVVLSMGDDGLAQQRAVAAGAVDYITKSDFSMAALQPWLEPLKRLSDAPS